MFRFGDYDEARGPALYETVRLGFFSVSWTNFELFSLAISSTT